MRERRWKVLAGWAATLALTCTLVMLFSPDIFLKYLQAESGLPFVWRSATLGTWLRDVFGYERYWLQFLPSAIGLILVSIWAAIRRGNWDWPRLLPGLLLISTICAAYGWSHDTVTQLPVVVVIISRLRTLPIRKYMPLVLVYSLAQLGMLVLNQLSVENACYYWYPLILAVLYIWQRQMVRRIPDLSTNKESDYV